MPWPTHSMGLCHCNTWRRLQVMKLLIMHFSPASCWIISARSKYSPQHPVLSLLTSLWETKFRTRTRYKWDYSFVYFELYVPRWDLGRQKVRKQMVASNMFLTISWIQFDLLVSFPNILIFFTKAVSSSATLSRQNFVELKRVSLRSLPCFEDPATGPYPKPDESSPHRFTLLFL
jgi:hypothetical protein